MHSSKHSRGGQRLIYPFRIILFVRAASPHGGVLPILRVLGRDGVIDRINLDGPRPRSWTLARWLWADELSKSGSYQPLPESDSWARAHRKRTNGPWVFMSIEYGVRSAESVIR